MSDNPEETDPTHDPLDSGGMCVTWMIAVLFWVVVIGMVVIYAN